MVMAPAPVSDSAVLPCSMAAQLSSTGISYHPSLRRNYCLNKAGKLVAPRQDVAARSYKNSKFAAKIEKLGCFMKRNSDFQELLKN